MASSSGKDLRLQ